MQVLTNTADNEMFKHMTRDEVKQMKTVSESIATAVNTTNADEDKLDEVRDNRRLKKAKTNHEISNIELKAKEDEFVFNEKVLAYNEKVLAFENKCIETSKARSEAVTEHLKIYKEVYDFISTTPNMSEFVINGMRQLHGMSTTFTGSANMLLTSDTGPTVGAT